MIKRFLNSTAARRLAWLTLVALTAGLVGPLAPSAEAQTAGRRAYFVPFTAAAGVDAEMPVRVGNATVDLLQRLTGDRRAKDPLAILPVVPGIDGAPTLSPTNPIVRRGLTEGVVTEAEIDAPPTTETEATDLARRLGLTHLITGYIDDYTETTAGDTATGELSYTIRVVEVPPPGAYHQPRVQPISGITTYRATEERERIMLRDIMTERASAEIVSKLIDLAEIMPEPQPEPVDPDAPKKKNNTGLYAALGALGVAAIIGIVLAVSGGGSSKDGAGKLRVSGVQAASEQDAVRVTWAQTAGAVGYNVYRRQVGNQPIISRRGPGRQASGGFTLLPNPQTNTVPTVVGGNRTSFIDTTAANAVIYEYGVAAVDAEGRPGPIATAQTGSQAGSNIGSAPQVTVTAGNSFVSLAWTPSSSFVSGYSVYRRAGGRPDTSTTTDRIATNLTGLSYDDTTARNGVTYTYIVQPFTTVGATKLVGNDSEPVSITPTAAAQPQAVRNVQAQADNLGFVEVTWQFNAEPVASYEILRARTGTVGRATTVTGRSPWTRSLPTDLASRAASSRANPRDARASRQTDLSGYSVVGTATASQNSFREGPLPNGVYTYAVRAVSVAGVRGPVGLSNAVTVIAPPAAPPGVTATGGDARVVLRWQAAAGSVAGYRVCRSSTPITAAMTGPATAPGITRVAEVPSNVRTYIDTTVTNNVTYYYVVTAVGPTGTESLFGKGTAPDTGVIATPHAAPTTITLTSDRQIMSGNGLQTAALVAKVVDETNAPVPGVEVVVVTDRGSFRSPLPAGASFVDTAQRQVRGLTDASGELALALISEVITAANQQVVANIQATAAELPAGARQVSTSISMQTSRPASLLLQPALVTLTADQASTANVNARVLDTLNQPVPDGHFTVSFTLGSDDGEIRRTGDITTYPFQRYPTAVSVPVTGGVATVIYRAGRVAKNVQLNAAVAGAPEVASSATIQLKPGAPTQVTFSAAGTTVNQVTIPVNGTQNVQVVVRDAQGNRVEAGVNVTFQTVPDGVVSAPATGVTSATGTIDLALSAGDAVGDAVITAAAGTTGQGQLTVRVR